MTRLALAALLALFTGGCTAHIAPYHPKHREFDVGEYGDAAHDSSNGSLWGRASRGLLADDRARRLGDVLVIQIDETDSASHDASTSLSKNSNRSINLSGGVFDLLQKAVPAMQLANLLGISSSSSFDGSGSIKRQGTLTASLPVRVRKILPNDDLYVEGTKVVMVGTEEHHLYISGIVRPVDVLADGTVPSSRVADAEIEYTGRGDVSDQQRPGWLHRTLDKVSPF